MHCNLNKFKQFDDTIIEHIILTGEERFSTAIQGLKKKLANYDGSFVDGVVNLNTVNFGVAMPRCLMMHNQFNHLFTVQ